MAEFVEFRAEEWVCELEQMERIRLFEPKEARTIAVKRKEFEYKIQRRVKSKADFLKYIQFEINLHRIIKARRKKTGIKIKLAEIEHSQTRRIGNLFKMALFRFPEDVCLWMSFFKFCKGVKFHSLVSRMLVRMLQNHSNKPELWVFASQWEYQQCKSVANARQFLTKGLRHHPSNEVLYMELFTLELNNIKLKSTEEKKEKEKNENWVPDEVTKSITEGKLAEVVYEMAVKTIPGVDIKVSLLNLTRRKKGPMSLLNKIFRDLVSCHLNEEPTWDAMAQMEGAGFSVDLNELMGGEKEMEVKTAGEKVVLRERIMRSMSVFEEAVKRLNTCRMWSLYVDHALKLNENKTSLPVFKANLLKNAVQGAIATGNLSEEHYLEWADILRREKKKGLEEVLMKGTEHHPGSVELWYARLRFYLLRDKEEEGMKVFNEAIAHLKDAVPVWKLMVKYLLLKSSAKAEEVFRDGIGRGTETGQALKPFYMEWLTRTRGIAEARAVFESPQMRLPPCLELFQKMAALESKQTPVAREKVRECHELSVRHFGGRNPSVWLDYVKFELSEGDKTKVALIHRRALKTLAANLVDEFLSEFNNFKLGLTEN